MTKTHLIIFAVIALFLLVFFGHGSSNYIEKKRMEAMNKGLVNRIMKHNDPDWGKKPKKPPPRTDGIDFGLDTSADKMPTDIEQAPGKLTAPRKPSYEAPSVPTANATTFGLAAPTVAGGYKPMNQLQQSATPAQNQPPKDDYYPPTPVMDQSPRRATD